MTTTLDHAGARRRAAFTAIWYCTLVVTILPPTGASSLAIAASLDETQCGILNVPGQYGPFDYRTATNEQRSLVEGAHFTSNVQLLIKGATSATPGPDIDYTLRAFPNHPRALKAMMDLGVREKTSRPFGSHWPVECYFNRALRLAPDDPQVRMVYGIFLLRNGDKKGAVAQLETARTIGASSGNFHYNLGLAYYQVQDYEKARLQAYKAKDLGYELEGLKNLLVRAGQWREREPQSAPPNPPPAATPEAPAPKN